MYTLEDNEPKPFFCWCSIRVPPPSVDPAFWAFLGSHRPRLKGMPCPKFEKSEHPPEMMWVFANVSKPT